MNTLVQHSPKATAKLLILNTEFYGEDRKKSITRVVYSRKMILHVSGRNYAFPENFLRELHYELMEFGWYLLDLGDQFAVVQISQIDNWVKLSDIRLRDNNLLDTDDNVILQYRLDACESLPQEEDSESSAL